MKESNKVFPSLAQAAAAVREGAFGTAAAGEKSHDATAAPGTAANESSRSFGSFAAAAAAHKAAGPQLGASQEGQKALVLSYAEQLDESNGAPVSTYVPFRNGLFLSSAASMALSLGASVLYYGAHHDDWAGNAYPDCSLEFVYAMNLAIMEGTGGELRMEAPFVEWSKADIVKRGLELGVPYELTWSCYEGGNYPCGACGTCIDRNRAFELNGVRDPLLDVLDTQRAQAGE